MVWVRKLAVHDLMKLALISYAPHKNDNLAFIPSPPHTSSSLSCPYNVSFPSLFFSIYGGLLFNMCFIIIELEARKPAKYMLYINSFFFSSKINIWWGDWLPNKVQLLWCAICNSTARAKNSTDTHERWRVSFIRISGYLSNQTYVPLMRAQQK